MNERIKKLRKALDLTQQEFADRIGMKRNTVANYETDRNEPSNAVISLICKTFNVNESWLRNGTGEMFAEPDTFSLDEYAASHGCTDLDIDFLKAFFDLDPDVRNKVLDHFQKSLARRQQQTAAPTGAETRMAAMEKRIEDLEKKEASAPLSPAPAPAQSSSRAR